jgi:hypothetical protein
MLLRQELRIALDLLNLSASILARHECGLGLFPRQIKLVIANF